MQFINTILSAAVVLASMVSAENIVQFVNQDNTTRHIVFTAQADLGLAPLPELIIAGLNSTNQTFPTGYIGNFYSYNEGAKNVPGMLGEVRFNGWGGLVFFDVSAIVKSDDTEGVKMMYPLGLPLKSSSTPKSGCNAKSSSVKRVCLTQYNASDDIATQATSVTTLVCLLGTLPADDDSILSRRDRILRRSAKVFPRTFVTGAEDVAEDEQL